ncbi:MAG: sporulation protein YqfD [Faecalibacterium sp.]
MNASQLWAAVEFTAENGGTEALLSAAGAAGLHLYELSPLPGGFCARCTAWHYRPLSVLARRQHVRLRIRRRMGLFFHFRPLLRRVGLWAGIIVFVPLLLWSQQLVWAVDDSSLTSGQRARAAVILREMHLSPGAQVSEAKLTAGEYALLQSGEFSWASLNFLDGRLTVEAAAAKAVPEIFSGTTHGLRAKASGTVVDTNLISGTMLVSPGQQVEEGQGLIGTARSERDGTLIFEPAAGTVTAQFDWETSWEQPLCTNVPLLTGESFAHYELSFLGKSFSLPRWIGREEPEEQGIVRYFQLEPGGFVLPVSVKETTFYRTETQEVLYTEQSALTLARMHSLRALRAAYPDAELIARKEAVSQTEDALSYRVAYTIRADICN